MKKYTLLSLLLMGFTFASVAQTSTASNKRVKKEKKVVVAKTVVEEKKVETPKVEEVKFVGDPSKPITFETLVIERNNIAKGTDDMFSFTFKNTGVEPVLIQNVQTSCGCTTAKKPEAPIQPGESAEISVKYDTNRVGAFTKTITVTSNVGEPIVLTIKGTVLDNGTVTTPAPPAH